MKTDDIARQHGFGRSSFAEFAKTQFPDVTSGLMTTTIKDSAVDMVVDAYKAQLEKQALLKLEEERIAELARTMPITSGANFEGYRIIRYAGYVSGDEVAEIPMGFFTGNISDNSINETIKAVRNIAIQELKEAAANLDCNAVIGLDFDYITIERSNASGTAQVKIVLTANGTAVEIEPL